MTADGTLSGHSWATLLLNLTTDAGGFSQFSDCATLSAQVAGALTVGCNTLTTNPSPTIVAAGVSRVFLNDPFLRIEAQLHVDAIDLGAANFSQTAQVSITLPDGFSFTSTSGVFLDPEPVPLSKWGARAIILILMAVGLVSTLGTRRRLGIRRM